MRQILLPTRAKFGMWKTFLFAIIAFVFTSFSAEAQTTAIEAEISAPEQTVAVVPTASDVTISNRIQDIFEATGWFEDPSVRVQDGVAFLDGTVTSDDHKKWARDLAAKTDGVVAVVNRLSVNQAVSWSLEPARTELNRIAEQAIAAMPLIVLSLLILPVAWLLAHLIARFTRWLIGERVESPFLRDIIARVVAFPVFLLGLYLVLQVAGLTQLALSIMGGAGVLGIVIGFAFRDIAENFLASLLLSTRRPFNRGDWIRVDGNEGAVQSMNTRSTVLISGEGNHIQIPNAIVFKNTIENFTAAAKRRGEFEVGVGYDASIAEVQDVIIHLLGDNEAIYADPAPMVLVDALGSATVRIRVYYWFDGWKVSPLKLKSVLLRQTKQMLTDAGISMPDEAREVIFPDGIPFVEAVAFDDVASTRAPPKQIGPTNEADEPRHSPTDTDLANEADKLHQQTSPDVADGETDLLGSPAQ